MDLPAWLQDRLGAVVEPLEGEGGGTVLAGDGVVAKHGPAAAHAREVLVLGELAGGFPLPLPELVEERDGWLVLTLVDDDPRPWDQSDVAGALTDLARLHAHPWPEAVLSDARLRDPLGRDLAEALDRARRAAGALAGDLPDVSAVAADPTPVVDMLRGLPPTLLHGDPWPRNVHRRQGERVWLDWGHAAVGPAVLDVATWLDQAPWALGWDPEATPERTVDAASVFWLVTIDVPALPPLLRSDPELAEEVVAGRRAALGRLGLR